MTANAQTLLARAPVWITAAAIGGIAWNIFGLIQFAGSVTATPASMAASGLTADQVNVMMSHPAWMTLAFAVGVLGGLSGSVLLLLRKASAEPVLLASLVAYVALWIGDAVYGVFAAFGASQVAILTVVVAIAAALYGLSRRPVENA